MKSPLLYISIMVVTLYTYMKFFRSEGAETASCVDKKKAKGVEDAIGECQREETIRKTRKKLLKETMGK